MSVVRLSRSGWPRWPRGPARRGAPPRRSRDDLGQVPHAHVAELHEVVVAVVLQADEAAGELAQVGGRVTRARGLLPRRVLPLVEDLAVAQDRVVLADDADLVVVPHPTLRHPGVVELDDAGVTERGVRSEEHTSELQ